MKISRHKSFVASCTCRPSQKTFTKYLILSLKSISEQCHLELSYKKVSDILKKHENCETSKLSWHTTCTRGAMA